MPTERACPGIQADMDDWVNDLHGWNFGIVGANDGSHPTGFHRGAFRVPTTDYSRRHDPGVPYNMEWACAGDYGHNGVPELRARHATLLGRLRANDPALWMVDEFIGQPWSDLPVYYWARWLGTANIKRYTGAGHTTWSHISVRRSVANHRAFLWRPYSAIGTPTPTNQGDDMNALMQVNGNPAVFLTNGQTARHLSQNEVNDYRTLHQDGTLPLGNGGNTRIVNRKELVGLVVGPVPAGFEGQAFDHGNAALSQALSLQAAAFTALTEAINTGGGSVDLAAVTTIVESAVSAAVVDIKKEVRDSDADALEGGAERVRTDPDA